MTDYLGEIYLALAKQLGWPATLTLRRFVLVFVVWLSGFAIDYIVGGGIPLPTIEQTFVLSVLLALQKYLKEKEALQKIMG